MKKRVHPLGHTLVVVASNGVWHQPGARRIPRGCALSVAGSLQGPHGTGLPAAPAASRFIDLVRPRGARLPSSAPQAREGWRSPRASIRAAKTPYVNICVALSRPFRCLRFARRPRGTCGSGGRGAARGTPKMGSSRGLSRDFRQSPASRAPRSPSASLRPCRSRKAHLGPPLDGPPRLRAPSGSARHDPGPPQISTGDGSVCHVCHSPPNAAQGTVSCVHSCVHFPAAHAPWRRSYNL